MLGGFLADPNFLVALAYQRLVVMLCQHCAIPLSQLPYSQKQQALWQSAVGPDAEIKVRGPGCEECGGKAVIGRRVAAEIIWVDETVREYIKKQDMFGLEQYLKQQGWVSYQDHALDLIRTGLADPQGVEQVIGEIDPDLRSKAFDYQALMERMNE